MDYIRVQKEVDELQNVIDDMQKDLDTVRIRITKNPNVYPFPNCDCPVCQYARHLQGLGLHPKGQTTKPSQAELHTSYPKVKLNQFDAQEELVKLMKRVTKLEIAFREETWPGQIKHLENR